MKGGILVVHAKIMSNDDEIDEVYKILREVFVREYKIREEDLFDELNDHVYHVLVYDGNSDYSPIATGRVIIEGGVAWIKFVAVKEAYRMNRYGDMVVRMLIEKAKSSFCSDIETAIPENLEGMFKKIGFRPTQGIPNIKQKNIFENSIRMKYDNSYTNKCH